MPRTDRRPTRFTFSEMFTLSLGGLVLSTAVTASQAWGEHKPDALDRTETSQKTARPSVHVVTDRDRQHSLIRRPSEKNSTATEPATDVSAQETNNEKRSKTLLKRPSITSTQKAGSVSPPQVPLTSTTTMAPSQPSSVAPTQSVSTLQPHSASSPPASAAVSLTPTSSLSRTTDGTGVSTTSKISTTSLTATTHTTTSSPAPAPDPRGGSGRKFSEVLSKFPEVEQEVKLNYKIGRAHV